MKRRHYFKITLCIVVVVCITPLLAHATVVKKLSDEVMANQAKTIVTGKVLSIKSEWNEDGTRIFTYTTISPRNFLKGDESQQEIVIKQLGGEVGDIGMLVEGTSVFDEGEEVLLFLRRGGKGSHRILGFSQGVFFIETDSVSQRKMLIKKKARMMRTQDGRIGKKTFRITSDQKLFLDDFTSKIKDLIRKK